MKNILAENMLRFRVKNLNESKLTRKFLKEQVTYSDGTESVVVGLFPERSKKLWANIKPEEKTALMAKARLQIEKHARLKGYTYGKSLKNVSNASIGGASETITTAAKPPVVKAPTMYSAFYPDITQPNPELNNFYLTDNEIAVSANNQAKFASLIAELKAQIPADETIQKIEILGGSSTSKVPTTLGGTFSRETGNVELAKRRCETIVATLDTLVKQTFPEFKGQLIKKFDEKPNRGPEYTQTEKDHFFGTGKLNPKFKAEYDKLYGPFKGSYGSILIETIGNTPGEIVTFLPNETIVSNYKIVLGFKDITIPKKSKQRVPTKTGGGISVGGAQVIPVCPIWK
jgi:hypothetical protein